MSFSSENVKHVVRRRNIVSVEGLIGSGKSTLLRLMKESKDPLFKDVTFMGEAVADWQMLETPVGVVNLFDRFYDNPRKYGLQFQQKVLLSLARREQACPGDKKVSLIMERSIDSSLHVFAEALFFNHHLSPSEFAIFREMANFLRSTVPLVPRCVIYVDTSVSTAMMRINNRGRPEEENINTSYLELLKNKESQWFNTNPDGICHRIHLNGDAGAKAVFAELMTKRVELEKILFEPQFR